MEILSENAGKPCSPARAFWRRLGPGLVTGAADDDPSGIATYSQAGAAFGYSLLWTALLTLPLMVGIQSISARIGRVTGDGLAANIRRCYPPWLLHAMVLLLLVANVVNIGADIAAMGAALALLVGGPARAYAIAFALGSLVLQVLVPYGRYAPLLKMLTLSLFAYVAAVFVLDIRWSEVALAIVLPRWSPGGDYLVTLVAVLGTTISPYLFFWQASEEVEQQRCAPGEQPLKKAPRQALAQLRRIRVDTLVGMALSNAVAFCIVLTAAVTLHANGITEVATAAQAAQALQPLAGPLAAALFAAGIIGTGLLAVPILAGSCAYAVAESLGWRTGLGRPLDRAKGFYGVLIAAMLAGAAVNFVGIDPIRALYFAAVVNGVIAVPLMALMMRVAARRDIMGRFVLERRQRLLGWTATAVMGAAACAMFAHLPGLPA